jgi:hypothetical protein
LKLTDLATSLDNKSVFNHSSARTNLWVDKLELDIVESSTSSVSTNTFFNNNKLKVNMSSEISFELYTVIQDIEYKVQGQQKSLKDLAGVEEKHGSS